MLGNELLSARLGGIYTLQRLAEDYREEYHLQVMELLCAFVRNPTSKSNGKYWRNTDIEKLNLLEMRLGEDVQAIISFILTRHLYAWSLEENHNFYIDLHEADLVNAGFIDAYMPQANLSGANLMGASCASAIFTKASLIGTVLFRAYCPSINLSGAMLHYAKLAETNAENSNFSQAELIGADLRNCQLSGSDLSDASIAAADLREAKLEGVNLSGANFAPDPAFAGLMTACKVTQKQLDEAIADPLRPPKIPRGLLDCETNQQLVWWGNST